MPKRARSTRIEPLKTKTPKEIAEEWQMGPMPKPTRVDIPKPPPPDVSVSFFAKLWAAISGTLDKVVLSGGIDISKLIKLPDTMLKVLILTIVCTVLIFVPIFIIRGC